MGFDAVEVSCYCIAGHKLQQLPCVAVVAQGDDVELDRHLVQMAKPGSSDTARPNWQLA